MGAEEEAAAAEAAEGLAGQAVEAALQLRELTDKGSRARKKKALTDFLAALSELGLSRLRTAVPPAERSPHAWLLQVRCFCPVRPLTALCLGVLCRSLLVSRLCRARGGLGLLETREEVRREEGRRVSKTDQGS